jgi:hypothetical protein
MDAAGVLPGFRGIAIHDGLVVYRQYEKALHGLCNAQSATSGIMRNQPAFGLDFACPGGARARFRAGGFCIKWGLHLGAVSPENVQDLTPRQGKPDSSSSRLGGSIRARTGGGGAGRVRPALRSSL